MQYAGVILTFIAALITVILGVYNARFGPTLTRKTDVDKMYLERLRLEEEKNERLEKEKDDLREKLEGQRRACDAETDELRTQIHDLREENLSLLGAREKVEKLENDNKAMHRLLKMYMPDENGNDVIK